METTTHTPEVRPGCTFHPVQERLTFESSEDGVVVLQLGHHRAGAPAATLWTESTNPEEPEDNSVFLDRTAARELAARLLEFANS